MSTSNFELQPGERLLYQTHPNRKWYALTWRLVVGVLEIGLVSFIVGALLLQPVDGLLVRFLPAGLAGGVADVLFYALVPLLMALWVAEDFATLITSEFVLTDRRVWMKGTPYSWNEEQVPIEEVSSMTSRRDAVFVRTKTERKLFVLMISDGKQFVKAYNQFLGTSSDQ